MQTTSSESVNFVSSKKFSRPQWCWRVLVTYSKAPQNTDMQRLEEQYIRWRHDSRWWCNSTRQSPRPENKESVCNPVAPSNGQLMKALNLSKQTIIKRRRDRLTTSGDGYRCGSSIAAESSREEGGGGRPDSGAVNVDITCYTIADSARQQWNRNRTRLLGWCAIHITLTDRQHQIRASIDGLIARTR